MTNRNSNLDRTNFFSRLSSLAKDHLSKGLATEPDTSLFFKAGPLYLDLSRQVLNEAILKACLDFSETIDLSKEREKLFSGAIVNPTERRAALHWLLRACANTYPSSLQAEYESVQSTLQAMSKFCDDVLSGQYSPTPNQAITDVVNLGVGGSDLGPRLAYDALKNEHNHLQVHFVANIDGNELKDCLQGLNPQTTLFVVTSKTFSTLETLENTKAAYNWLTNHKVEKPGAHFAAATSRPDRAAEFGIEESRIFGMWDWVGGRYSLMSSVGLALMLGIGHEAFNDLRSGAREIDEHVRTTPLEHNAAFLQACVGIIAVNGLDVRNHGVIAYDSRLELLPNYLQQLEMESNGKSVDLDGNPLPYNTCPILWGGVGTNTQHSFHQLLHQGTVSANIEFLLPLQADHGLPVHQAYLQANCLAQADALVHGKTLEQVQEEFKALDDADLSLASHKVIPGNRPCSIIGYEQLTPRTLGALIALYEHKVFMQSRFWNLNPFDQWGVELGKQLCQPIFEAIQASKAVSDPRTQHWVDLIRQRNEGGAQ